MMIEYLKKLMNHKWYVFVAGVKIGGIPIVTLLFHDISKFTRDEFMPYVNYNFGGDNEKENQIAFDRAWNHHQKRNKHHWQYWLLINDEDGTYPLDMPKVYIREMVADWMGASKAYTGSWCMVNWMNNVMVKYLDNMSKETIDELFSLLHTLGYVYNGHDGWYYSHHDLHR